MEKSWVKKIVPAFEDERGIIEDVFDGEDIRHIGFITSKKGTVRGNHYHKKARQYTYILRGKVKWVIKDISIEGSQAEEHILGPHELAFDAPLVAHAMVALED